MQIFVEKDSQQTGPFPIDQVRSGLVSGLYQPTDLAWYEGAPKWVPLAMVPGIDGTPPPLGPGRVVPQTSGLAICSLICGVFAPLTLVSGIPAVICGHLARGKINRSGGALGGNGFAITGLTTGYFGIFMIGIATIAGLTAPLVLRQRKKADLMESVNNARQIGLALNEFETKYGTIPTAASAMVIAEASAAEPIQGDSSNARFRQLMHSNITDSEQWFFAKAKRTRKPDGKITGNHALASGECAFAYIESAAGETPRPVAIAPFIPGTGRLDPDSFDFKAVVLWSDASVTSVPIDRAMGQAMLDGRNILDPGHPVWNGSEPVILLPE